MTKAYIFMPDGSMPDGSMPEGLVNAKDNIVIEALKTRLGQISVANGYLMDLDTIEEWRVVPWSSDVLPAVDIRNEEKTIDFNTIAEWYCTLPITLALAIEGEVSVADARKAGADIIYALGHDSTGAFDHTLDGNVLNVTLKGDNISVVHTEYKTTVVTVSVNLEYTTAVFDVYDR